MRTEQAPSPVKKMFEEMLYAEIAPITREALRLRKEYIASHIVTTRSLDDALHVAIATTSACDIIVSWNFKHIVHYQKIPSYNAVNILNGFLQISIYSPMEVIEDGNEKEKF